MTLVGTVRRTITSIMVLIAMLAGTMAMTASPAAAGCGNTGYYGCSSIQYSESGYTMGQGHDRYSWVLYYW